MADSGSGVSVTVPGQVLRWPNDRGDVRGCFLQLRDSPKVKPEVRLLVRKWLLKDRHLDTILARMAAGTGRAGDLERALTLAARLGGLFSRWFDHFPGPGGSYAEHARRDIEATLARRRGAAIHSSAAAGRAATTRRLAESVRAARPNISGRALAERIRAIWPEGEEPPSRSTIQRYLARS